MEKEFCEVCRSSGMITFPASRDENFKYFLNPGSRISACVPCLCDLGKALPDGYSDELQRKAFDWRLQQLRAQDRRPVSVGNGVSMGNTLFAKDTEAARLHKAKIEKQIELFKEGDIPF